MLYNFFYYLNKKLYKKNHFTFVKLMKRNTFGKRTNKCNVDAAFKNDLSIYSLHITFKQELDKQF